MFALCSDISIGKFSRVKPNNVKINKSMYEFVDRAVLKMPITSRIKRSGAVITESVETAKQFSEGDKVTIQLGYNGSLKTEFTGFISRVNFTAPLEVECEGYSYQLRKKTLSGTYKKIQLKDLLKIIIRDTDIVLDSDIPDFLIEKIILTGKDGCRILEELRGTTKQLIRFFFTGNVLYGGLIYAKPKADVKYRMRWNVIKDGNLKLRQAKNQEYTVHWIGEKKDGTKVTAKTGTKGVVKTHTSHLINDAGTLKSLADAEQKKLSFDGYEGKITAFGIPYCEPGYRCILEDTKYQERRGNYLVENTEVNYGMSGFRRIVGIGAKL